MVWKISVGWVGQKKSLWISFYVTGFCINLRMQWAMMKREDQIWMRIPILPPHDTGNPTNYRSPPVFTTAAAREMKIVWWFSKRELVSLCFWMVSNSVMMPVVLQRCFTRRQAASSGYSTTIIWRAFSALTIFPKSVNEEEEVDVLLLANVYIQTKKHGWRLGTLGWKWMAFTLVVKSAHGLLLCKVTFGSLKRKRERDAS